MCLSAMCPNRAEWCMNLLELKWYKVVSCPVWILRFEKVVCVLTYWTIPPAPYEEILESAIGETWDCYVQHCNLALNFDISSDSLLVFPFLYSFLFFLCFSLYSFLFIVTFSYYSKVHIMYICHFKQTSMWFNCYIVPLYPFPVFCDPYFLYI